MALFRQEGTVWELTLPHDEVGYIHDAAHVASILAPLALTPAVGAVVAAVVESVSGVIRTVDLIGGNNGVNVVGILYTQLVTVTPAFVSPLGMFRTFAEALQQATGLPDGVIGAGIGAGITWLAAGPAMVVLGGVAGWLGTQWGGGGTNPGDVWADRRAVGAWERFTHIVLNPDKVAMLSWRGYFAAEDGGGQAVHANRNAIGPWEIHSLERNPDGTVSLRAQGGHYLVAEMGGGDGSVCNWNRTQVGDWEKFWMEYQPDGTFALKTFQQGTYVSVQ